jgi:glycosyltransferase involved in cell wall biosynthesis
MTVFVRQGISSRLSQTAMSLKPWPDQPVGIALVITDLDVGGAEHAIVSLATHLQRTRWDPTVFCLGQPGPLVQILEREHVHWKCLHASRQRPIQVVRRLVHALMHVKPQLIQSFMFHANLTARMAAPWVGWPWTLAGLRVAERQKHWHLTVDRMTTFLATGSVCVSEGVRRFTEHVGRLDPSRLVVIPNGIDPAPYDIAVPLRRSTIGIPDTAHLALYLGRLDVQKGLPDLIHAAERVIAQRPGWHLALAGDGPSRGWLLEQLAKCSQLQTNVRWLGHRSDVCRILKAADLLVHASLWEGMPNAVLEAMAASRPVVGTRVEGTEDLVVPNKTGWLVPPNDVDALSRALITAYDSPEVCQRYGREGRLRITETFSLDATVTAYERLWAGLLGFRLPESDVFIAEFGKM